ncbi:FMN-binding protein [bacterium]|nr:FMN-binding protein [bacterium]
MKIKNRIIPLFLLLLLMIPCSSFAAKSMRKEIDDEMFIKIAKRVSKSKEVTLRKKDSVRYIYFKSKQCEGYVILSSDFIRIKGYNGPTNLAVVMGIDLKIQKVVIIETMDTGEYINYLKKNGFLKRFIGLSVDAVGSIDAISGCTISSEAIKKTIAISLEKFGSLLK